jgi:hypothetical protein
VSLPGEEISAEILDAIRAAGISTVETCEEARSFIRIKRDIIDSKPYFVELDALTDEDSPLPGASFDEGSVASGAREEVEKVIDGQLWTNPPTVAVRRFSTAGVLESECSGTLIGPAHLLTSAHCFTGNGTFKIAVAANGGGSCISANQPAANPCLTSPTATNVTVTRHPGYSGQGDWDDDMAIVRHNTAWLAPANTSSFWMRINNMTGALSANYWVSGYGVHFWNGANSDRMGRIALQVQNIDWADQKTWFSLRDTFGVGAPCTGDSGGPAILTSFGFDLNIGVQASTARYAGHSCPSVEEPHQFRYAHPGRVGAWIAATVAGSGGTCTDFLHNNTWHYLRCW